jgi:(E)-4-hydroxy-3-methylbut-2-enyl-diphosphate synthase
MTNTDTRDASATIAQIRRLTAAGCEIVRVAVPDAAAAAALKTIRREIEIPLVADIHFDHRLALAAVENGVDGLRINPGNIGGGEKVRAVAAAAGARGIPIRIGVNAGSMEKEYRNRHGGAVPEAMVESALSQVALLESVGFHNIKVSLKASDVGRTLAAYRLMAEKGDLPLHLGVTEAGGLIPGTVKSALGIGMLLAEGIGDTLRVSLTRDPVEEVRCGYEILRALGIRRRGPELISCPTCGRCRIDLFSIAERVEQALAEKTVPIRVAVMGCVVNGPGEAGEADVGITGGDGVGVLFKKGKPVRKIPPDRMVEILLAEVDRMEQELSERNT